LQFCNKKTTITSRFFDFSTASAAIVFRRFFKKRPLVEVAEPSSLVATSEIYFAAFLFAKLALLKNTTRTPCPQGAVSAKYF